MGGGRSAGRRPFPFSAAIVPSTKSNTARPSPNPTYSGKAMRKKLRPKPRGRVPSKWSGFNGPGIRSPTNLSRLIRRKGNHRFQIGNLGGIGSLAELSSTRSEPGASRYIRSLPERGCRRGESCKQQLSSDWAIARLYKVYKVYKVSGAQSTHSVHALRPRAQPRTYFRTATRHPSHSFQRTDAPKTPPFSGPPTSSLRRKIVQDSVPTSPPPLGGPGRRPWGWVPVTPKRVPPGRKAAGDYRSPRRFATDGRRLPAHRFLIERIDAIVRGSFSP